MKDIIEKYMRIAIEEAMIAKEEGENPFGAVLYFFFFTPLIEKLLAARPHETSFKLILFFQPMRKASVECFHRGFFALIWLLTYKYKFERKVIV